MIILQVSFNIRDSIHRADSGQLDSLRFLLHSLKEKSGLLNSNILPALIAATISVLVLAITLISNRRDKKRLDRENMTKKILYFAATIKPIIDYAIAQVKNIRDEVAALRANPADFPLMIYAPKNAIEKVTHKIDEELFFHAFTTHYRPFSESVRTFKNITAVVEYQDLQLTQLLEMVTISMQHDYERRIQFKETFRAARDLAANATADETLLKYPEFLAFLSTNFENFLANRGDGSNLAAAHNLFVMPVMMGIAERGYIRIPVGLEIANRLHTASEIFEEIKMQTLSIAEDFEKIAAKYEEANETLKKHSATLLREFLPAETNPPN